MQRYAQLVRSLFDAALAASASLFVVGVVSVPYPVDAYITISVFALVAGGDFVLRLRHEEEPQHA